MDTRRDKLDIQYVPINSLRKASYNPRRWTDEQKEQLQKSLENFDFVEPLVVNSAENRKNVLIGGHFRLAIARKLGYKEVPVVFVNIPDKNKEWYKGSHKPLIAKKLFHRVRKQYKVPEKVKWGSKFFIYKGILKCASCKSSVIGEERYRKRKYDNPQRHVYYHCSRQRNYKCHEPFVTEKKLEKGLLRFINFMYINHPKKITLTNAVRVDMEDFGKVREEVLVHQNINPKSKLWDIRDYAQHVLYNGDPEKKRELFNLFDYQFYLQNRNITSLRAH